MPRTRLRYFQRNNCELSLINVETVGHRTKWHEYTIFYSTYC
ncbi:hypothetical protein SAMN04488109_0108 [Chryseolinea serpens]|uniref:Uncharacterized protein n=1 Tax=Chryseolinea serpens TaxID=947013 RepID=A0A1M5JJP9_9BACT|nr:hypothetical protein SAMN04488109_0108 [Chryseolinea serpens]